MVFIACQCHIFIQGVFLVSASVRAECAILMHRRCGIQVLLLCLALQARGVEALCSLYPRTVYSSHGYQYLLQKGFSLYVHTTPASLFCQCPSCPQLPLRPVGQPRLRPLRFFLRKFLFFGTSLCLRICDSVSFLGLRSSVFFGVFCLNFMGGSLAQLTLSLSHDLYGF